MSRFSFPRFGHLKRLARGLKTLSHRGWRYYRFFATSDDHARSETPDPTSEWQSGWREKLIEDHLALGFDHWPRKLKKLVRGKDVLDVGCGHSLHGIGFVVNGAATYLGQDKFLTPNQTEFKSKRDSVFKELGYSLDDVQRVAPNINFFGGPLDALGRDFDIAVLHNVTEHLEDPPAVISDISQILRDGGLLVVHHHNFYAWDGHHTFPKTEDDLVGADQMALRYADWGHLTSPPQFEGGEHLNQIKLDSLRGLLRAQFKEELWHEIPSWEGKGGGRVSEMPDPAEFGLSKRDLRVKNVLAVYRKVSS